ncbi:phosphotransferase [Saccharopolyspora sp. 6T]|uniref:phosphotransferase n=1 Tax=Saccharopolyspora sp. 6T TaxID=2877238 RepID=UPI001CD71163|nr:phosphotransferase [Saccharopolyspora sp. 6T]MCA1188519.1 phosphotransferase [Saccharopolyspora sp. 6T]
MPPAPLSPPLPGNPVPPHGSRASFRLPAGRTLASAELDGPAARLVDDARGLFAAADPVLVHGDFQSGNALWADARLSGVVDWEGAACGRRRHAAWTGGLVRRAPVRGWGG